ncbi:MAG: RNA-splicing ligase RtcB [Candidatus Diapherotrites archaeon]|uniref:tRNA-splicing ligase RtcB n=1 Tax=Candidatus Iainarchaeum sp. TaxID=3101447 RepID=A0A2D6M0U4_9ARCH|nr:RNA-splicing ligase RtcB [Candidatus Diapherotrites archaeon]|tara:strand:- start:6600 stop:9545 length:2946 start_codon:yes stop_codon:yes gene_type:complete
MEFKKIEEGIWRHPKEGNMGAPARIYANDKIFNEIEKGAIQQLKNVSTLPGIQKYAIGQADMHWGYGFPIGGVAGIDYETGVVSPGGIGFDINCLKGDARVLHKLGYTKPIKDFEKTWFKDSIKCLNPTSKVLDTGINAFMEFKPRGKVFRVETESGKEVVATAEHPFFTEKGMVKLKELKAGDEVSVYSFEGVGFEEPSNRIIVNRKDIEAKYPGNKNGLNQIIKILEKKELLPLRENNEKLPYLIKLLGFIQGDGHLSFSKKGAGQIAFYGKPADLEKIREDGESAGFKISKVHERERKHSIKTAYNTIEFERTEYSIRTGSSALATLLFCLGTTAGNKTIEECKVPKWLFSTPPWMKRLYLASFFGAELSSPSSVTGHGFNIASPLLSMNKREANIANGRKFIKQIAKLLKEFGIKSGVIRERDEFVNKEGEKSIRLRLQISSAGHNLIGFFEKIGFEYNKEKQFLGLVAAQYLRLKQKIIKERKECEAESKRLHKRGLGAKAIYYRTKKAYPRCNLRFVERSIYGDRKTGPRIAFKSPKFSEFIKEKTRGLGKTGQVWNKIISKEEITLNEPVYDFNVASDHHNFIANCFVVSNCGVRLVKTNLTEKDIRPKLKELLDSLFGAVPAGMGEKSKLRLNKEELAEALEQGSGYVVEKGFGWKKDLEHTEENGKMDGALAYKVSDKAMKRGMPQFGTLGSGNHFLELQRVDKVFDSEIAKKFGLSEGQITIMIHCGSRGFGHQVATDYLNVMTKAMTKYGISVPDKQLCCAPINSEEGQDYLEAMKCAVNYAFCNRQVILHWVREVFEKVLGQDAEKLGMDLLYDICHNVAKEETHTIDGKEKKLLVHRKGATRAMPAGRPENSKYFTSTGHPALIPGTMGTASYVLVGTEKGLKETFGSLAHGAGRTMSRHEALRRKRGEQVKKELEAKGELIMGASLPGLAEEMPEAYKDVDEVIKSVEVAGIGKSVSKHVPLAVMKG